MLTSEDMLHLARLARLAPDRDTLAKFCSQCADIIAYMDILSEVDTTNVEPLYSPVEQVAPCRNDEPQRRQERADILANAPESDGRFFIVPRIV